MQYQRERLSKEIEQAIVITIGLGQLDLPVLLLIEIFDRCDAVNRCLGDHLSWKIIKTVKQ